MRMLINVLAVSSITILGFAGCGDSGSASKLCNALADKSVQCDKNFDKDKRGALVASCIALVENDPETKADLQAMAECTNKSSCEDYKECKRDKRKKRRAQKIAKGKPEKIGRDCRYLDKKNITDDIKKACAAALAYELGEAAKDDAKVDCYDLKALSKRYGSADQIKKTAAVCAKAQSAKALGRLKKLSGDMAALAKQCSYTAKDKFSADVKKLCETSLVYLEDKIKKATVAGEKLKYTVCSRAKSLAKKFGAAREKAAKLLCATNRASAEVKKAMDKAAANVSAKKPDVPFECKWALKELAKLEASDWSKKTKTALVKLCYVDLGIVIAETRKSKHRCDWKVKRVIKAAKQYKLLAANPQLLAALQKHNKCEQELQAAQAP